MFLSNKINKFFAKIIKITLVFPFGGKKADKLYENGGEINLDLYENGGKAIKIRYW